MEFNKYMEQLNQLAQEHRDYKKKTTGKSWTIEQDTLAYMTDAAAIGREVMADKNIFAEEVFDKKTLGNKLAQNIWWLAVIAKHADIDLEKELQQYLNQSLDLDQKAS